MGLEVKDFIVEKKKYKFEAGEFILKPPFLNIVKQAEALIKEIPTTDNKVADGTSLEKVTEVYIKILCLLLEETENGKLSYLTEGNVRIDVAETIIKDFFQQFRK